MLSKRSAQLFNDVVNWNNQLWTSFDSMIGSMDPINALVEATEENGKIKYAIDVPGVTKDQLSLVHEGKYIRIEAKRTDRSVNASFTTSFSISSRAKAETLEASLQNGVLYITFDIRPDSEIRPEPKRIEIKETPKLGA